MNKLQAVNRELGAGLGMSILTDGCIYDEITSVNAANTVYDFFQNSAQHTPYLETNMQTNQFAVGEAFSIFAIGFYVRDAENIPDPVQNVMFTIIVNGTELIQNARVYPDPYSSDANRFVCFLEGTHLTIPPLMRFSVRATFFNAVNPLTFPRVGCFLYGNMALPNSGQTLSAYQSEAGLATSTQMGRLIDVNEDLGAEYIASQQGTTQVIYDTIAAAGTETRLAFFQNFAGKTFAQTNLTQDRLDAGYSQIFKQIDFQGVEPDLYSANMEVIINSNMVVKYFALFPWTIQGMVPVRNYSATADSLGIRLKANLVAASLQTFQVNLITPTAISAGDKRCFVRGYAKNPPSGTIF